MFLGLMVQVVVASLSSTEMLYIFVGSNKGEDPITTFVPLKPAALSVNDFELVTPFTHVVSNAGIGEGDIVNTPDVTETFLVVVEDDPQLFTDLTVTLPVLTPHLTVMLDVFCPAVIDAAPGTVHV